MTVRLLTGDVRAMLATLPSDSVHCIVTSPPYYGLRAYGTDPQVWCPDGCDGRHVWADAGMVRVGNNSGVRGKSETDSPMEINGQKLFEGRQEMVSAGAFCANGCWRGELGSEPTPSLFIEHLLTIFREVRRVLHPSGTVWLNMGDSYAGSGKGTPGPGALIGHTKRQGFSGGGRDVRNGEADYRPTGQVPNGLKPKDLMMLPSRLTQALQMPWRRCGTCAREAHESRWGVVRHVSGLWMVCPLCLTTQLAHETTITEPGWWVRAPIVWDKRSCMPESVPDRPTNAHEMVYLLAKRPRYYYDAEAVREPHDAAHLQQQRAPETERGDSRKLGKQGLHDFVHPAGRNMRNVWRLGPAPVDYDFCLACGFFGRGPTRPARFCRSCEKLARRCTCSRPDNDREPDLILTCPSCGSTDQWVDHYAAFPPELPRRCILAGTGERGVCPACLAPWRRVVERGELVGRRAQPGKPFHLTPQGYLREGGSRCGVNEDVRTTGWAATCTCDAGPPVPATVLDPFAGTGTTLLVADRLGRDAVGIELSPRYSALCRARLSGDSPMFAEPELPMPPDEPIADSTGVVHATLPLFEVTP